MKIRHRSIMASESDGNYDISFKKSGTTYYIEMLSDGGNYVAKWWDSSDNGLGYNNKGWVAIEGKNYRALNNIEDVNSDNVVDLLSVISDYDRKPGKPIQDRIKREVAKLVDFGSINSGCTKKSVKSAKEIKRKPRNVQVYFWKNNAYNAVVMTDGEYWIIFDETFDGIDLYDEDVIDELKSYVKTADFNSFDDMYNQFADDENMNAPVVGDNFGAEFDSSELTKVGTIYEGKTNSACGKKSVKASAVMGAMDIENLTIYVPSYCYVDVMVDSYEQGEGEQVNSWTFQVADGFRTAQELIDDIAESSGIFSNDINDYVVLDSSLQTDATVNAENDIPTEEELEAWKRGELELYVAHLWVRLQVGSATHDMSDDEAEAFGLSVY